MEIGNRNSARSSFVRDHLPSGERNNAAILRNMKLLSDRAVARDDGIAGDYWKNYARFVIPKLNAPEPVFIKRLESKVHYRIRTN